EYRGLDVASATVLRKKARESGVYLRVLKNTLVRRAIGESVFGELEDHLVGPLMYAISEDAVAPAKLFADFAKENKGISIKAGVMRGSLLDADVVNVLSDMPSCEEVLAKLLVTFEAPITQFVRTLYEVPTMFVRVFSAVQEQKENA